MFKDFIGKEVKIILSTNSRPAIGATGNSSGVYVSSGVINAFGVLKEVDDKFLKFEKFRYTITRDFTVATTLGSGISQSFGANQVPMVDGFKSDMALVPIANVVLLNII